MLAVVACNGYDRFVRALVYVLIVSLSPGATEVLSDVGHEVFTGHSLHDDHDAHHDSDALGALGERGASHPGDDEHRCTGLFHLCGCHAPTPTVTTAVGVALPSTSWSTAPSEPLSSSASLLPAADGARSRHARPPIA